MIEYTNNNTNYISDVLFDSGIGTALTLKGKYYTFKPITVRFDIPFYVNNVPSTGSNLDWRFIIGIDRAF